MIKWCDLVHSECSKVCYYQQINKFELSDVDGVGHVFLLVCGLKDKYVIKSVILDTSWGYVTLNTTKHQSL